MKENNWKLTGGLCSGERCLGRFRIRDLQRHELSIIEQLVPVRFFIIADVTGVLNKIIRKQVQENISRVKVPEDGGLLCFKSVGNHFLLIFGPEEIMRDKTNQSMPLINQRH